MRKSVAAITAPWLFALVACGAESAFGPRPKGEPLGLRVPTPGVYSAFVFEIRRPGQILDLLSQQGTRLVIELRPDGRTTGQLKITADPELRTKRSLNGRYEVSASRVRFTFQSNSFLEEVSFFLEGDTLSGTWFQPLLEVTMRLARLPDPTASAG